MHLALTETRIRRPYPRPRAVFAEPIVAALINGTVAEFPAQAWDIDLVLPRPRRLVRVQVKCSGERAPQDIELSRPPRWEVKEPSANRGPPPEFARLGPGFHCEVFVLARHEGWDISDGWHFYVLPQREMKAEARVNPIFTQARLVALGVDFCGPSDLRDTVMEAARAQRGRTDPF